ncbi:MAG TPA: PKD domain-containing protein [Baekduia sp.]
MRRRLAFIVTTIAVLSPAAAAHAAFFPADAIDGPSADIRAVNDLDIARDGNGAVTYQRTDGGINHIYVSRLVNGAYQPPERVDAGIDAGSTQSAVAVSDGGRVAVVFIAGGSVFASVRAIGAPGFGAPQLLASGASDPSVDMSFNGAAYATYTVNGDVLAARMDRTSTAFAPVPTPLDINPADTSGVGTDRSHVAISADGTGIAVWGENGHVFVRRLFGLTVSTGPEDLTVPDLDGHAGGPADSPDVDIEDDSSYAWVTFRQQFADGAGQTARAIGVRVRGSRSEPPVAFDGLGWGGQGVQASPRVDINGKGQGVATVGTNSGAALAGILKDDILNPARPVGGSGVPAQPIGAVAETTDRVVGWVNVADAAVHGVFYDDKADVRTVPGPGPDTILSNPAFGPVDPAAGFDVASDRTGDFSFVFVQGTGADRRLVAANYDRLPGAFQSNTSSKTWRNVVRQPLAWGTSLELWGPLTYSVQIDGKVAGQTQTTKLALAAGAVSDGIHKLRIVATDRRGQIVQTAVRSLKVDTVAPTVSFKSKTKGRTATVTAKAADVLPPSGRAAGVKYVRIDWGDGGGYTQATKGTHTYGHSGAFTVRVSATDNAGNAFAVDRVIHIGK